jgi:hypothetical protein
VSAFFVEGWICPTVCPTDWEKLKKLGKGAWTTAPLKGTGFRKEVGWFTRLRHGNMSTLD